MQSSTKGQSLTGWGGTVPTVASLVETTGEDVAVAAVKQAAAGRGVLARGLARSYGDAAQNSGGTVLYATRMDRILSVDVAGATVVVEAGVSLDT